jgi:uncharacterized membrane protein
MNKEEFLKTLENYLEGFTEEEKAEILYDYEEHFRIGLENGKTEDALIEELGDPLNIATQYKQSNGYEKIVINQDTEKTEDIKSEPILEPSNLYREQSGYRYDDPLSSERSIFPSLLAAVSLLLFNAIFVLWLFIGLGGGLIGLFGGAIGAFFGGIALTFGGILQPIFSNSMDFYSSMPIPLNIFLGIGTTAFGALFFIGDCYLAKYFIKGTIKYVKWNLSIIRR